jgi:Rieske 2Fe-2S family protein
VRCPYHSWSYGLDGRLRHAPWLDDLDPDEFALREVAVDEWGGFVFVHLDAVPGSKLAEQLGDVVERCRRYPLDSLRRGHRTVTEVAANWKLIAENYNECYHCGSVHPELCELVPVFRQGGRGLDWSNGIPHRDGAWTFTVTGDSRRAPFPGLDEHERTRHKGELVYPNLLLSLAAEHVVAFRLLPTGPATTTVVCDYLFHPDEVARDTFDPSDAVDFWEVVNRQDWAICESVQRGMRSRSFTGGWFAPMEDDSLDISRWYRALMGDAIIA